MRLMLGTPDQPRLLVNLGQTKSPTEFDFYVVNGQWAGTYTNGHVTVWHPDNPWSELDHTEILTDNQDRLRGNYADVFDNFSNLNYIAPMPKQLEPSAAWDDDIVF